MSEDNSNTSNDQEKAYQNIPMPETAGSSGPTYSQLSEAIAFDESVKRKHFKVSKATMPNTTTTDYSKRRITIRTIGEEYQENYTVTCLLRTAPNNMLLPKTFLKLLECVNYLCENKTGKSIKGQNIIGFATQMEGGALKAGLTTWEDLCVLTADPFPLVLSEKDVNETGNFVPSPLYSVRDGVCSAIRYSNVGLSPLGQIVCRYYKKVRPCDIVDLKTIVPLSLIRVKMMPWALGFLTVNYSYNIGELFKLQSRMLMRYAEKPDNPTPWLLPDSDVEEIFKGIDVGDNYEGYVKNRSLMGMFHLGKGSVTIVPKIEIDRTAKEIKLLKPPLGKLGTDTVTYLNYKAIGKGPAKSKLDYSKFRTFQASDVARCVGNIILIPVASFMASDREIVDELQADDFIRVSTPCLNTELVDEVPEEQVAELNKALKELDIQDAALDNFKIDTVPIHELLWRHIIWEYEMRLKDYKDQLKAAEKELEVNKFLEKVTRPVVSTHIASLMNYPLAERKRILMKTILATSPTEDRDPEVLKEVPEGFTKIEIDEICRPTSSGGFTPYCIPNIMKDRKKYENLWIASQRKIDGLKQKINTPGIIYGEIKEDLDVWSADPAYARKTKMHFIDEVVADKAGISYNFAYKPEEYKEHRMPCTIYYNSNNYVVNYGRNMNYVPRSEKQDKIKFTHALNVLSWDYVYFFLKNTVEKACVYNLPSYIQELDASNEVRAIIPHCDTSDILVVLNRRYTVNKDEERVESMYFIIPKGGYDKDLMAFQFPPNCNIVGFCYLDVTEYVEFLSISRQTAASILHSVTPTAEIPRDAFKPTPMPKHFYTVLDVKELEELTGSVDILYGFDIDAIPGGSPSVLAWDAPKQIPRLLQNNYQYPWFTDHMELYNNKTYIPVWENVGVSKGTKVNHGKKSIIDELIWCNPRDPVSIRINTLLTQNISSIKGSLRFLISNDSLAYSYYRIRDLDDWSIINKRFKLPTVRPEIDEILEIYDGYMDRMFSCKITDKEYREVEQKLQYARTEIIKNTDFNPFQYEVVDYAIPTDINTNGFNESIDPDEYSTTDEEI